MEREKLVAIVLAAGRGRRMENDTPKQYLMIDQKPVIYYSLAAFEKSSVDEIVLVVSQQDIEYCETEIVEKYKFKKVIAVVAGGTERYHSVYAGLSVVDRSDYVFIHDGARPCINQQMIRDTIEAVKKYNACVVGMPVKDTIKKINQEGFSVDTPVRDSLWLVQTPQAFSYSLIKSAYDALMKLEKQNHITDDAMVIETMTSHPVKMIYGRYQNIKITTPEDLEIAEIFIKNGSLKNKS